MMEVVAGVRGDSLSQISSLSEQVLQRDLSALRRKRRQRKGRRRRNLYL
jgi:hypothetical protein